MQTHLLIVDPQTDFCAPDGALSVPGADADMARLAALVRRLTPRLDAVHVTLDTHHALDIAHPLFWQDAAGQPPAPFTTISAAEVEAGRWRPVLPGGEARALAYVWALDAHGRYPLSVWPPHCLLGSAGHAVLPVLFHGLQDWEESRRRNVDYVVKGLNPWTEHYSALRADVPDPADPGTQPNLVLIDALRQAEVIGVAGEAGSHCVANTVRDLAELGGDDLLARVVLLVDAVSPVSGFAALQAGFIQDMTARGMKTATTTEWLL